MQYNCQAPPRGCYKLLSLAVDGDSSILAGYTDRTGTCLLSAHPRIAWSGCLRLSIVGPILKSQSGHSVYFLVAFSGIARIVVDFGFQLLPSHILIIFFVTTLVLICAIIDKAFGTTSVAK